MKKTIKHRLLLGLLLFTALLSSVPSQVFAVTGTLSFQQPGGNVRLGDTFTVRVVANVGKPFWSGGATIGVTYPSTIQAVSASSAGGALGGKDPVIGNGRVDFTVFNFSGKAVNNEMLFTITFKAASVGNARLAFTPESEVNDGPTTGTPVTFVVIPTTCPSGQIGTPPNCKTPAPSPSPTPSSSPTPSTPKPTTPSVSQPTTSVPMPTAPIPDATVEETPAPSSESDGGLKIENVKVTATRKENSIAWTVNSPDAIPTVSYGTSKSSMSSQAIALKQEDGSYEALLENAKPGTLYYFSIKATTPDQLKGADYSGTLTTRGYPVQLTIQQDGVLAPGAKVSIEGRNFTANKNAIITTELGEGTFEAMITAVGAPKATTASFTVVKKVIPANGNPELQSFTLNAVIDGSTSGPDDSPAFMIIGGVVATVAAIGGFVGFILYRRRNAAQDDQNGVIDQDLLISNYGPAISDYQANTPAPNLDSAPGIQPLTDPQPLAQNDQFDATYAPATETNPNDSYEQPITEAETVPSFDPGTLPLPPEAISPELMATSEAEPTATPYSEEEQTAPELIQVESEQQAVADTTEPSAVYDAATGELDIIHHHDEAVATQASAQAQPQ